MVRPVIGALALLLALAGCGGDPQADPSPTTSVTKPVSTTPTPTATVPVLPTAAAANTKAGAKAFVRHYVDLINHLQATGDEQPLLDASLPTCRSCKAVIRAATTIYDAGGHVEGGNWSIDGLSAATPELGLWKVRVDGQIAPSKVFSVDAAEPKTGSGGNGDAEFFVSFTGSWKVGQWHTG
jgi:hypothetical protein